MQAWRSKKVITSVEPRSTDATHAFPKADNIGIDVHCGCVIVRVLMLCMLQIRVLATHKHTYMFTQKYTHTGYMPYQRYICVPSIGNVT